MSRLAALLALIAAPLAALAPAHADVEARNAVASGAVIVTLKARLDVAGDTVRLSDLFDGVPADIDAAVARAPEPGLAVSIDPEWLRAYARRHRLDWPNAGAVRRVTVRRESQVIDAAAVADLVAAALAARDFADYAVTLSSTAALHAPVDVALAPAVAALTHDPITGAFSAELTLAEGLAPHRVTGRAEAAIALPVLTRPVSRGGVVTEADITYVATPASRAPADALMSPDAIIGLAARRALRPGVALKAYDLERPTVIAKGEIVTVRFTTGALELTTRARALDDVAEGDVARFVNVQSSRIIEAVAMGPGEAWLATTAPASAAGGFTGGLP